MLTDFFFCWHTGVETYLQNNKHVVNKGKKKDETSRLNNQKKKKGQLGAN